MGDVFRWLIAVEVLGLSFLPLTVWVMKWLPDRGYIFSKVLGLLLVTYLTWLIGEALPVARQFDRASVRHEFASTADRHLDDHGGNWCEDHAENQADSGERVGRLVVAATAEPHHLHDPL